MAVRTLTGSLLTLTLLLGACEDPPPPADPAKGKDAGAASTAAVDPALATAMAAADQKAKAAASAATDDGPPESGVFAPGAADRQLARGAPAKVTLGNSGAAPRVSLTGMMPTPGKKVPLAVSVTKSISRNKVPPIDFDLVLEAAAPKDHPKDAPLTLVDAVAKLGKVQATGFPPEELQKFGKLKGTTVSFQVRADGGASDATLQLAKGADPNFEQLVGDVAQVFAAVALPYPSEPVGVGAYWMATTRETVLSVDTVTYRMVKIDKIEGDLVSLTVTGKRYAASDRFDLADAKGLTLMQFRFMSEGTVTVKVGGGFPETAQFEMVLAAVAAQPGTNRGIPIEVGIEATLRRP